MKKSQKVGRLQGAGTIELGTAEIPGLGPRDVLIEVAVSGICGTDLSFYRSGSPPAGAILGHEFSGTVTDIGKDVTGIAQGDRVVANPMVDGIGLGHHAGSFAEFLRLPDARPGRNIFCLPAHIPSEIGALVEPFAVGLHAANRAGAQSGERAVIFGAGPVGLCVLAALRARGLEKILVVDPSALRRSAALSMGALAVHNPQDGSSPAFVAGHFGADQVSFARQPIAKADIAFDCAGVASVLDDGIHSLALKGRFVIVADPHKLALPELRLLMLRELSVLGALAYEDEFSQAIGLLERGEVDLSPLITHRFPLDQLPDAFAAQLDAQQSIKVLVNSATAASQ